MAGESVTGSTFTCPSGKQYWAFVGGETGTCGKIAEGVFECSDIDSDRTIVDCDSGCERFDDNAGCNWKIQGLGLGTPVGPHLTVECHNGKVYKMEHEDGRCERVENGAGEVTGGQCTGDGGAEDLDSEMDCDSGCQYEQDGASCECVSCS